MAHFLFLVFIGWAHASCAAQGLTDLRSALSIAMTEHPALLARQADIGAAQSEVDAARWQYWPTPTVSMSQPDKALIKGTDRVVSTYGVRQPLWTGGRLDAGLAYAGARKQTAEAVREETRRDVALEVIQAWGEACTAQSRVAVLEGSLTSHRQFLGQIQRRTSSGLSVQSDVALARSRHDAVLADLSSARAALNAAQERLRTLTGGLPTESFALPQPLLTRAYSEALLESALQQDPSLVRLKSELQEIQAQIDSSKSVYWPELSASVTQRHGDITGRTHQIAIGFESRWGAGLSNNSAIQAAIQRQQGKQQDIEHRTRKLIEQVRFDGFQLETARNRVKAFEQALEAANAVSESWSRQFAAGKKSWQDVMNAVRESTQTELQLVDAKGTVAILDWRLGVLTRGVSWVLDSPNHSP